MSYWIQHFVNASLFAKAVYLMLLSLSVVAWAIIFRKLVLLRRVTGENARFLALYRKNRRDPLALHRHMKEAGWSFGAPLTALFTRGCEEIRALSAEGASARRAGDADAPPLSILQVESLEEILVAEMDRLSGQLERGQTFLATVSSVSPLMGLLGTVWGILESFRGIGLAGSATAASMAPGLAEALITTISGLMVAIPANLFYNFLGQKVRDLTLEGDNYVTEFITNLQRYWGLG